MEPWFAWILEIEFVFSPDTLNNGKSLGYQETITIDDAELFREFAIKKIHGKYLCYAFSIEATQVDSIDDYSEFEVTHTTTNSDDAIHFIEQHGGIIGKFQSFKGVGSPI